MEIEENSFLEKFIVSYVQLYLSIAICSLLIAHSVCMGSSGRTLNFIYMRVLCNRLKTHLWIVANVNINSVNIRQCGYSKHSLATVFIEMTI